MRHRRGFILFFGTRPIVSDDPEAGPPVSAICPRCGQRADMIGKTVRHWFTLFFLPMFPLGSSQRFSQCTRCGAQFPIEARQLGTQVAAAERVQSQRAISLYNSLRNSPANAITLNELMTLYAHMGEYDQAISAARDFPQALNASEQCMTTLGRVYLARNNHAEAIQWFDHALQRNETLGEAHYYKGVAYLTSPTPDFEKATAAARSARVHGYPGAESLLRESESRMRGDDARSAPNDKI
jgi:tetratricopeptide (TPR) repeat protein